jgi:hypothetical protein
MEIKGKELIDLKKMGERGMKELQQITNTLAFEK